MGMFSYYAMHSFVNQIRKLFRTWILIFILVCGLLGGLIGFGAGVLSDAADRKNAGQETETEPEEEWTEEEEVSVTELLGVTGSELAEAVTGLIILGIFIFEIMSASKNGSKIFLMADVNLLFSSPMKPHVVLLFRLMMQMGVAVVSCIYLIFQIPNLIEGFGLSVFSCFAVLGVFILTLILGRLLQVLFYLLISAFPKLGKNLNRIVYLAIGLILAGFVLYWKSGMETPAQAAVHFLAAPQGRWIPLWGWLKTMAAGAFLEQPLLILLGTLGSGICIAGMLMVIPHLKVDFYEDAMSKSEETAEVQRAMEESSDGGVGKKRKKKDRSEKLRRDGMKYGFGANVYFFKSMYNRFRFAHLGFFTKTSETYLAAALGVALLEKLVLETNVTAPIVLTLGVFAFFRTLGNPLEKDTSIPFFGMIPEKTWKKLFWSVLGGSCCCLLDCLIPLIAAPLILGGDPLEALCWLPFIASVDFYGTAVGTFINISTPASAGKTLKQIVQVMFIYFGLLPDIILIAVCGVFLNLTVGAVLAAAVNLVLGGIFLIITPKFLMPGTVD